MKTISSGLKMHLGQDLTTLATCWKITRIDGTIFTFTDHDSDLVVSGVTYSSENTYSRTAIKTSASLAIDNLEIVGVLDLGGVTDLDVRDGKFDYASVQMFLVNWQNLSQGMLALRQGWLGEVVRTPTGVFQAELRGLTQAFSTIIGDMFQPICRADLGDSECTFNVASVTGTGTVGSVTSQKTFAASAPLVYNPNDNTLTASVTVSPSMTNPNGEGLAGVLNPPAPGIVITINGTPNTFTVPFGDNAGQAIINLASLINAAAIGVTASSSQPILSSATLSNTATYAYYLTITLTNPDDVATLTKVNDENDWLSLQSFGDNYMDGGVVTWLTGLNAGSSMEINTYVQSTETLTLYLNMASEIQIGDTFNYYPGCDKRRETCFFKFNNMDNFRGEPDVPGIDATLTYPDFNGIG